MKLGNKKYRLRSAFPTRALVLQIKKTSGPHYDKDIYASPRYEEKWKDANIEDIQEDGSLFIKSTKEPNLDYYRSVIAMEPAVGVLELFFKALIDEIQEYLDLSKNDI